ASATALATQMVREFGLSEAIGPVSYSGPPAGYPALAGSRGYSEHTQQLVDQEVAALLTRAETRARDLLTSHRQALAQLTAALLEQETVTGDQVRVIAQAVGPAPSTEAGPAFLAPRASAGGHRSRTRPSRGSEQQMSTSPSAGSSTGEGE